MLRHPAALVLVLLMGVGSVCMWLVLPAGLVWLAAQASSSSQVTFTSILIVVIGLPIGMFAIAKLLGSLDRAYSHMMGRKPERHRGAWMRSMRGERGSTRPAGVLDKVMIVSVALALVAVAVWFFGFAGSSLPSG